MSFMKMRQLPPRPGFSDQAKKAAAANRAGQRGAGIVPGRFARWWPREDKALWIAICPTQAWTYQMYDRDAREVKTFENQYWYGAVLHRARIGQKTVSFYCSAGPYKDQPCWGCGVQNHHWDWVRAQEESTGVKPNKQSPVSAMPEFTMSIVVLEQITKVPVRNPDGTPRMSKAGKPIVNDVPLPLLPPEEAKAAKDKGVISFGLSMHWSNGIMGINELQVFDRQFQNRCANCAGELSCSHMGCPDCGQPYQVVDDPSEPATGEDLLQLREAPYECDCGYKGVLLPDLQCKCGEPESGSLVSFALQVKTSKVSENKRVLQIVGIKPLQSFVTKYPAVEDLLLKPLEIDKICAPERLESQLRIIPEHMRGDGVTPMPKGKETAAVSYEFNTKRPAGQSQSSGEDEDYSAADD